MERCPLCNARLRGKSTCNRCEADLHLLLTIKSEAEQLGAGAVHSLLTGEKQRAGRQTNAAQNLHNTTFHRALSGFIKSMAGED